MTQTIAGHIYMPILAENADKKRITCSLEIAYFVYVREGVKHEKLISDYRKRKKLLLD